VWDSQLHHDGYEHIGQAGDDGGYDWAVFDVWVKDGVFYWASDAGCSCNYPYMDQSFPADFEGHGSAQDALHALAEWGGMKSALFCALVYAKR
jgi:hypothetical protein